MSVTSQEHQSQDFQVEQAIAEGMRQANEVEPELEITLEFTDAQGKMLMALASALTLSPEVLLESAISYVHFHSKVREFPKKLEESAKQPKKPSEESHKQIQNYPKRRSSLTKKLTLAAETSYKIEELGMTDKINECVVTGIQLLYDHLIDGHQKSTNE